MQRFSRSFRLLRFTAIMAAAQLAGGSVTAVAEPVQAHAVLSPERFNSISAAVTEASARFRVPEAWIRSVMHQESHLEVGATSPVGAMGLMQVMPGTYAELQARYGLGVDPYDVRNNVMAGTAYLREMFDRYGAPGFLAAYNAGPKRWEEHLTTGRALPSETVAYVSTLGPMLRLGALPEVAADADLAGSLQEQSLLFVVLSSDVTAASHPSRDADESDARAPTTAIKPSPQSMFVRRADAIDWLSRRSTQRPERATPESNRLPSRSTADAKHARESSLFVVRRTAGSKP